MFKRELVSFGETGLFDGVMRDYLLAPEKVQHLYTSWFDKTGFIRALREQTYTYVDRPALVKELQRQAESVKNSSAPTLKSIELLNDPATFTVTTGHQLCLFTGPLYFVYKIISVINLAESLRRAFPDKHFVPVYWMATEDHDFAEINHAKVFGKTVAWSSDQKGAVGDFTTLGMDAVLEEMKTVLGTSPHATELMDIFSKAYTEHNNLAEATRFLVNELFGRYGLITIDPDTRALKQLFTEELRQDLFDNLANKEVSKTIEAMQGSGYHIQVNPRPINLFYKAPGIRERIEWQGERYVVLNTSLSFSKAEMEKLLQEEPEHFSPNVVMRPLYQQKILPNVAYVGGPGELAYWLEYKTMFEASRIHFPVLVPRQFAALVDKGSQQRMEKLTLGSKDLFTDAETLVKNHVKHNNPDVDLSDYKNQLSQVYDALLNTVNAIDKTLSAATEAERQKSLNGVMALEQKVLRALKQKSEQELNQIRALKGKLFPEGTPQERYDNFGMYYSKWGPAMIDGLKEALQYNLSSLEYVVLLES